MYYLTGPTTESFYSQLFKRENADLESIKLFGTSRACIDYQSAFLREEIKSLKHMHVLPACIEDIVCALCYYIRHYHSLKMVADFFSISPTSFVRFEQQLVSILANKWTSTLMIDLDSTPLSKFAFAVPNTEFLGTGAIWDSTPIEVQISGSPEIVKQYIHPHYKSTRGGHQTSSMRCIRYGFATLPNHLELDVLKSEIPDYLDDFDDWGKGLPINIQPGEFDPKVFEGLCIGVSDGYLGATHDSKIFDATDIGPYITNGLSLVSDCALIGQEKLLGRSKKNRGTLHIRHRKPKGGELSLAQKMENGRINSFRKQIEDYNNKFKEYKMFAHKYRNSHNELDNWIKYTVGVINFNLLEKKEVVSRLWFYAKDDDSDMEDSDNVSVSSEEENVDIVTRLLHED